MASARDRHSDGDGESSNRLERPRESGVLLALTVLSLLRKRRQCQRRSARYYSGGEWDVRSYFLFREP
jgi:hypothetical protein